MIVIDGVVGAGKTTLMKLLADKGYVPFEEPVMDNPLLDRFYHDRERYGFALQVFFLNRRFRHIKNAETVPHAVLDRSIYGDVIFAKMLHDKGEMSKAEFDIYWELYENMLEHCPAPKLMIYLEISVEEAISRIRKRGRPYEMIVEREYWETLNQHYREYFAHYTLSPLLTINVDDLNFEDNQSDRDQVLDRIEQKLSELSF